jgi:hypothetical protein
VRLIQAEVDMDLQTLACRVEVLELQNRRLKRWLAGTAVIGLSAIGMGQVVPPPDEVRTRRFVLVNDAGEVRGELTAERGVPALTLHDAAGDVLIRLTGNGSRAVLEYLDHRGDVQDLAAPPGLRPLTRREPPR